MPKTKVEVYDKDQLIYPYIESDHVTFSNGMKVTEMLDQSISMPTITHNETSFKVGVGDSDVSSSIVDSSVSKMVIKGQTYQNILPEPSTHVLTNNKEMFKVNEGLDSNVEIVDGVSKSAVLKGQTLVNLFQGHTSLASNRNVYTTYNDGVYTYQAQENYEGNIAPAFMLTINLPYKPIIGKTYTVFATQITGGNSKLAIVLKRRNGPTLRTYSESTTTNGLHKFTFTHDYDGEYAEIPLRLESYTTDRSIKFKDVMIIEGDYSDQDIPYFTGMSSCKMPVLCTTGKNLFDFEKTQAGYLGANPHSLNAPDQNNKTSDYIRVKPNTSYTYSFDGFTASQVGNEYWTGWYYCTSPTEVSKKNMNRQVARGSADTFKTVTFTTPSDCYYVRIGSRGLALSGAIAQLEEGSTTTSYEPYKSNILTTPEDLELRGIGDVKDTLDCLTGEVIQRIGEFVVNGTENWNFSSVLSDTTAMFSLGGTFNSLTRLPEGFITDSAYPKRDIYGSERDFEGIELSTKNPRTIFIKVKKSSLNGWDETLSPVQKADLFKSLLSQNPITFQYQLETPVIKTVDLSSSGNWEKIVLDGKSSENWKQNSHSGNFVQFEGYSNFCLSSMYLPVANRGLLCDKLSYYDYDSKFRHKKVEGISDGGGYKLIFVRVKTEKLPTNDVAGFKQWLSQNPIEVSYMLSSHQDSTQVKQPIFFKDGHIIQSSGTENSLIPTLDYQAKTSNSYVMDLMKTNTRYTMKAKSASGTFTIDGTSYGAGTNGTFTTSTSMTNKFLVMSNKTNEEVMIIEEDVVSKTIPYFKGIKSAFEDESKIEVLSTGKNLFNIELVRGAHGYGAIGGKPELANSYTRVTNKSGDYILAKPNTKMTFTINNNIYTAIAEIDKDGNRLGDSGWRREGRITITTKPNTKFIGFNFRKSDDSDITVDEVYQASPSIEESPTQTFYEPYKSNNTKIPLLSPLRSLPNGVCDELIIDRLNHKAKLIQRVGHVVFTSNLSYHAEQDTLKTSLFSCPSQYPQASGIRMCDRFLNDETSNLMLDSLQAKTESEGLGSWSRKDNFNFRILTSRLGGFANNNTMSKWLKDNPTTILYHLKTPIITEVDLEGFPYIYKDGHIFLNSEIVPTTEIIYSINQCQQISASNEDIIRHEKELTYLQKLIAQYVQVDYESALLSLKV